MKNKLGLSANLKELLIASALLYSLYLMALMYFPFFYGAEKWMFGPAKMTDEIGPAWSPDGKRIAFTCGFDYPTDHLDPGVWDNLTWRWQRFEICIFNTESGKLERITYGRHKGGGLWSSTGNELAWFDDLSNEIKIWDVEKRRIVYSIPEGDYSNRRDWMCEKFTWTNDAQDFFYPCKDPGEGRYLEIPYYDPADIVWSPDRKYVVFNRTAFYDDAYGEMSQLIIAEGKDEIYHSELPVSDFNIPEWTADSSILAWGPPIHQDSALMLTYISTGETAKIPCGDFYFDTISWSPTGVKLALAGGKQIEILELKFDLHPFLFTILNRKTYFVQDEFDFLGPTLAWSPDEKYIAYESSGKDYVLRIWILNIESGEQTLMLKR